MKGVNYLCVYYTIYLFVCKVQKSLHVVLFNRNGASNAASLGGRIKVSTVHAMSILSQSDPPSSGLFSPVFGDTLKALLQFHKDNGSPLMINPYPFFAYQSDPRPETLAFCLFQPNAGRVDSGNGIKYMNMFDAQVRNSLFT